MAEIAIPILALGGLYVIKSQKKKQVKKEQFKNFKPNSKPILLNNKDKYFMNSVTKKGKKVNFVGKSSNTQPHMSLTGNPINDDNFKHDNMVPFFSGTSNGSTATDNLAEARLDQMQGGGSQFVQKKEQAPLFEPQSNLNLANGAPNVNDFMQTRINPSMKMSNIKPWDEERVAPGLNKGFNTNGGTGFNTGMESRELWQPKTVDELRTSTNPKNSYSLSGHQGPANSSIKETGNTQTQGRIEKHAPDTYYSSGPDRWFTTTGAEKASTARGIELLNDTNRQETTEEYYGAGGNGLREASYTKGIVTVPRRPELKSNAIANPTACGRYKASSNNLNVKGYHNLPNNRSTTQQNGQYGGVQGIMKALVAPILDVVRPSRKENLIGNLRPHGNAGCTVANVPIFDPNDITKETMRQMTEDAVGNKHHTISNTQGSDGYTVTEHQPISVQRDTTNNKYLGGAGKGIQQSNQTYDSAYNQRMNENKDHTHVQYGGTINSMAQTASQTYNAAYNQRNNTNKKHVNYTGNAIPGSVNASQTYNAAYNQRNNNNKKHVDYKGNVMPGAVNASQTYNAAYNQRNNEGKYHVKYTGNAAPGTNGASQTYHSAYNQRNNDKKTQENRTNQGGTQIFNQTENITNERSDNDRINKRHNAPNVNGRLIPSKEIYGKMYSPYEKDTNDDRINPDLLTAFKNNPYTQSLNSS